MANTRSYRFGRSAKRYRKNEPMSELFSIKKLLDFSPLGFYKVIGLSLKFAVIVLIILGVVWVKNTIFPSAPANVNQPEINVASGGTLEYKVIQNPKKKTEYFAGGFGSSDKDGDWRAGLFGGIKW